jgi:hypothetical protein
LKLDLNMQVSKKMDEQLAAQLEQAGKRQDWVQAWFRLKNESSVEPASSPEKTEVLARNIVDRVKKRLGENIHSMNIQRSLGTFTVAAKPTFLKEILHEPEVVFAGATYVPGLELIKPVRTKVVVPPSRKQSSRTGSPGQTQGRQRRKSRIIPMKRSAK